MWQYNSMDELYHYGILGMRWGVRRGRKSVSGIKTRKAKTQPSEDSLRVQNIRKKKVKQMSNQELRDVNQRMQLENQYRDLKSKRNVGKKVVTAVVATGITIGGIKTAVDNFGWAKGAAKDAASKLSNMVIRK